MSRENHHLFPDTFYTAPLESWAAAIQRLASEARQCLLEQIVHYKVPSGMEHEFLVVYASHPSGSKIVLGVDRHGKDFVSAASKLRLKGASASQGKDTTYASIASSSAHMSTNSTPLYSSSSSTSGEESLHLANDSVQVSHDGTPAPILAQHGPCVALYTITFPSTSSRPTASTSTTFSSSDTERHPSLLHLSVLLLTIRAHFPSYTVFRYQCYFFASKTCLALMDLFDGVKTGLEGDKRAGTWRGAPVSQYSRQYSMLQFISLLVFPELLVPLYFFSACSRKWLYGNDSKKTRQMIPDLYHAAWDSFGDGRDGSLRLKSK